MRLTEYFNVLNAEAIKIVGASKTLDLDGFKKFLMNYDNIILFIKVLRDESVPVDKRKFIVETISGLITKNLYEHSINMDSLEDQIEFYLMFINSSVPYADSKEAVYERILAWFQRRLRYIDDISWLEQRIHLTKDHKELYILWKEVMIEKWIALMDKDVDGDSDYEWLEKWKEEPWRIPMFLTDAAEKTI